MKNKVFAAIGGFVALFGLGYLIYVVLFGDATFHLGTGTESIREEIQFPYIVFMEIMYAVFVTMIFTRWANIKTFSTGLKAGFMIGLFIGFCHILHLYAVTNLTSLAGVAFETVSFGVRFAVAGGVIGAILGNES